MKLIDMLVEDGLNGWKWPDGIEVITQDNGNCTYKGVAFGYAEKPYLKGNIWLANNGTGHADAAIKRYDVVADDWSTSIITREQYEAALAAKNDGWIEWGGGKFPPVSTNTIVDVKFKKGYVQSGYPAGEYSWEHNWQGSNIIAYRLHKQTKSEQVRADAWNAYAGITEQDDEADLNECIGQAPAPVWSGEGLPTVGHECEWQDKNTKQWNPVKVVYASEWVTVIREINKEKGDDLVEIAIENYGDDARLKFRPTRSEADRKRYDAVQALCDAGGGNGKVDEKAGYGSCWFDVYDAIAAGKIPGVKLDA